MSQTHTDGTGRGAPRYQRAVRDQMVFDPRSLDQLLPADHQARTVWAFVAKLDLQAFYAEIQAVEGSAGRPPVDPAILVALWLLATLDGVASAREVERRCTHHTAYRWLCGEVSVNHHLLSDFRAADPSLDDAVYGVLGVDKAVAAFRSYGSTGPDEVRRQMERWKQKINTQSSITTH